jgi:hypothetical protein
MYFTPSIGTDGLQAGRNRHAHFWFASIEIAKDASVLWRTGLCDQISQLSQREKARNLVGKIIGGYLPPSFVQVTDDASCICQLPQVFEFGADLLGNLCCVV